MTAPDTNVEKQARRHRGPLSGIIAAIIVAVVAAYVFAGADEVAEADAASATVPE